MPIHQFYFSYPALCPNVYALLCHNQKEEENKKIQNPKSKNCYFYAANSKNKIIIHLHCKFFPRHHLNRPAEMQRSLRVFHLVNLNRPVRQLHA